MAFAPRAYARASPDALVAMGLASVEAVLGADPVPDPPLRFGHTDLSGRTLAQQPDGVDWRPLPVGIAPNPAVTYLFHDATVHGADGVVTVGRHVLAPSLAHVWDERADALADGDRWLVRNQFTAGHLDRADHLLAGDPGNYFHWLLDGVARLAVAPGSEWPALLPWTGAAFQQGGPPHLPGLARRGLTLMRGQALAVGLLRWTTSLNGAGGSFHPVLCRLAMPAPPGDAPPGDGPPDIYISRADSTNRPLRNEAAVERLCADRGFAVLRLATMPFAAVAAAFGHARRVVAPHGAGLANLLFAHPGAAVLELHSDCYANWCFRRLCATMGLRYGCLVGTGEPGEGWVHARGWSLDPAALAAALDDPRFQPE